MNRESFTSFLLTETRVLRPPIVPELLMHSAGDFEELWATLEERAGRTGSAPPYWSVAWPGGLGLARMIFDRPSLVTGKTVLDVGAGSGICAIAAALAGASRVIAADIDPDACQVIVRNAELNGAVVTAVNADPIGLDLPAEVVLAADLWYERFFAQRVTHWLRQATQEGRSVLMADPGRSYAPRGGVEILTSYRVAPAKGLEKSDVIRVNVLTFRH